MTRLSLLQQERLRDIVAELTPAQARQALASVEGMPTSAVQRELMSALQTVFDRRAQQFGPAQRDFRDFDGLARAAGRGAERVRAQLALRRDIPAATADGRDQPLAALLAAPELVVLLAPAPVTVVGRSATRRISLGS